ncbi:MAG: 3-phosphoshikimate 1-carboxyvinyltransferase [Gammaproteobacteria bacterium]|nr:3-phosphoshikimate 1-carboxyvinyltransferase [Gammaproteobacteria bacterium]
MYFKVTPSRIGDATVTVPGDKSISHRALLLGAIADGRTDVSGFLAGEDCLATLAAMRALGISIRQPGPTELAVEGAGRHGLRPPSTDLDLGNSGTAMRLMAGLLAGQPFDSVLTGDSSLNSRPMGRIIKPLSQMGAEIHSVDGRPPLRIKGKRSLQSIEYVLPVASAQVKSAVLLAGLYATGRTSVIEPATTRDHTERMLGAMGVDVFRDNGRIGLSGGQALRGCAIEVPGDLSSASFLMLAAILAEKADILIEGVGVNPTRTGIIDILLGMGADIEVCNPRSMGQEPVADIRVRSSQLRGCAVDPALVSLAIDEFPVLFVAAAAAAGKTVFTGIGELRVKESDRIAAMANGMRALGIRVQESEDGAMVEGGRFAGGCVESYGDHRVAMSLAMAATSAADPVEIRDVASVDTSFPGFVACLASVGADIELLEDDDK